MNEQELVIPTPEPIFKTFEEGLALDIHDIKQHYNTLLKNSNFLSPGILINDCKNLKSKFEESLKYARKLILLYMSAQPEYSFFNLPSADTVFINIQKEPALLFNESFRQVFRETRKRPALFAKIIRNYFSKNLDSLFYFSWSTFPSIYNFFTVDYFLQIGYDFISQFISSITPLDIKITDYLLLPYFFCAFEFLSKFWLKISYDIMDKINDESNFFDFLINSIVTCSCFISYYHKHLIFILYHFDSNRCLNFFFNEFLKKSFEIISKNEELLFSSAEIDFINNIFDKYSKLTDESKIDQIIDAFTYGHQNAKENFIGVPKMPDFVDLDQVTTIISSYDIGLFYEIILFSKDDEELKEFIYPSLFQQKFEEYFQKGFIPFILNDINPNKPCFEKSIFPKEYDGFWNSIVTMSSAKEADPMEYYVQNIEKQKSNPSLLNNEQLLKNQNNEKIDKYVYLNQIFILERKYRILYRLLRIKERNYENTVLCESIQPFLQPLIWENCEQQKNKVFKNSIPSEKVLTNEVSVKINSIINSILSVKKKRLFTPFMTFCTILDSIQFESDEIYLKLTDGFLNTIKEEKNKIQNSLLAYRKVRHVLDKLCSKFSCLLDSQFFGRKFKVILLFVDYIQNIDFELFNTQNETRSKFLLFFKYVLCVLNHHAIFDAFLIVKMIMKKNPNLLNLFDEKNRNNYNLFHKSMMSFLSTYKQELRCLSYIHTYT